MRKINVGCGSYRLADFENYDVVDRGNIQGPHWANWGGRFILAKSLENISFEGAGIIYAGHFIEHLPRGRHVNFLKKVSQEAPNAELFLAVPILDNLDKLDWNVLQDILSFPQNPSDMEASHRTAWRVRDVIKALEEFYEVVERIDFCRFATSDDNFIQAFFKCSKGRV